MSFNQIFAHRVISGNSGMVRPLHSPDLVIYVGGYFKEGVCISKPQTIQLPKDDICIEIGLFQSQILNTVIEKVIERTRLCVIESGIY